jgi:hypothetical protein
MMPWVDLYECVLSLYLVWVSQLISLVNSGEAESTGLHIEYGA